MIPRTAVTMSKREVLALLVVFIVYVVIGGAVFMAVEGPREEELRSEIARIRQDFHERLASLNLTELNSTDIKAIVARLADARSKNLMDEHGEDTHTNWNFYNSFFFAITVVTTIGNFDGDYIWIYKTGVVLWIIFGLGYLAMILNYISRAMRCKQIRRVEDRLSASFHSTQHKFGQRLDEIHRLLQEFASKQKSHRKSIWRGKSSEKQHSGGCGGGDDDMSADSLCGGSDKNHNTRDDQIQRLLTLVETLKEESTQNLCRTRQLIETHNLRLQLEAPYHLREELLQHQHNQRESAGGLPRGEVAPSRRHSLPVLHTDGVGGGGGSAGGGLLAATKDYLQVKFQSGHKNRSHLEFPTNFFTPRASIPLCNGRLSSHRDSYDGDVYDVEIAVTKPMVTFDLDSLDSTTI